MNINVLCFLLVTFNCVHIKSSSETVSEDEIAETRRRIVDRLTKTRTVLRPGYHLAVRHVGTDIYTFRGYRTVSILTFPVVRDILDAQFTFQAEELHMNAIGSCTPKDVVIKLKHGSYAAVNPDGYDFPKDFIEPSMRENIHTIELQSNGAVKNFSIHNPRPGTWYALVYNKWEDPKTAKVEQQGLVAVCQTILYSDLQVKRDEKINQVDCYTGVFVDYGHLPIRLKCMSSGDNEPITLNIETKNPSTDEYKLRFMLQANYLPKEDDYLIACSYDPVNSSQVVTFQPFPDSWHYIYFDKIPKNNTHIADCESYSNPLNLYAENNSIAYLMRDDKGRFFTFDFGVPTPEFHDVTSLVNLTSNEIQSVSFHVNQFIDIGGTITVEASLLKKDIKYYMGYTRELQNKRLAFSESDQYVRVVVCLDIDHTSVPQASGTCLYNDVQKKALFVLNSTDSNTIHNKFRIPYPESGSWYLTFRLFCDDVVCPCETSDNGTKYYVQSEPDRSEGLVVESGNNTRDGVKECNATVLLSISSSMCVGGKCSNHGDCLLNTFGGLVMSFCSCMNGYGGWDCSDDSRMDSNALMLASILLLTLSNLLFVVSVYVAVIRHYFIEAMIYAFTMVFSTFYHACDAPRQIAYCILRGNVLQFGDFYCGLMSFWMTLLVMSIMPDNFRSYFQLTGAIVIALLTTWNMHAMISFLLPVVVGVAVVLVSWFMDYRKTRVLRYKRSYYTRHLPVGLMLVAVGLICYAFLQTEKNYMIVHSVWHMIIASCVIFLLPDVKRGASVNPFLPSKDFCRFAWCKRNQTMDEYQQSEN